MGNAAPLACVLQAGEPSCLFALDALRVAFWGYLMGQECGSPEHKDQRYFPT